jgi:hypothetical protein
VLLPSVLLWEEGRENAELLRLLAANVRDPDSTQGDLAAQIAACRRGGERLVELCQRDSCAVVEAAMDAVLEVTSSRVEAELRQWPTSQISLERFMDYDALSPGTPVRVAATVGVEDGVLVVDVSRSAEEVRGSINVPWSSTHTAAYYALLCFLDRGVSMNEGLTRHVRVVAPEGNLFRPRFPRPVPCRRREPRLVSDLQLPDDPPRHAAAVADRRRPRGRRRRPSRRSWGQRDRHLHVELCAAAGRDRRGRVPVARPVHRAPGGLGRCGPLARRARHQARL